MFERVLTSIGVRSHNTGNPASDVDTFVNQCATLAALAHPNCVLVRGDNKQKIAIGIDTLTCGPASIAGLHDHIIGPLRRIQNQHLRNTQAREASAYEALRVRPGHGPVVSKTDITGKVPVEIECSPMGVNVGPQPFLNLDEIDPSQSVAEAEQRPSVFFDGADPRRLSEHLASCHHGKALVHLAISEAAGAVAANSVFVSLRNGVSLKGRLPFLVEGRFLSIIPSPLLNELVLNSPSGHGVAGNSLWLTGDAVGCGIGPASRTSKNVLPLIFESNLRNVLGARFSGIAWEIPITEATGQAISSFAERLYALEIRMPGISLALRGLLPTLIFGTSVLSGVHQRPDKQLAAFWNDVWFSLGEALANRMVDRFEMIRDHARLERLRRIGAAILSKLDERPHTVRELTRRFYRLPTPECREVLDRLALSGAVVCDNDTWKLTVKSNPTEENQTTTAP